MRSFFHQVCWSLASADDFAIADEHYDDVSADYEFDSFWDDFRPYPYPLTGDEVLRQMERFLFDAGDEEYWHREYEEYWHREYGHMAI